MPDYSPSLLIYGLDATLLQTRRWVLEASGYRALTATHWSQFVCIPEQPPISLLILCHSLDKESCCQALKLAGARWPGIQHLVLGRNLLKSAPGNQQVTLSLEGPVTLISNVNTLVGHRVQTLRQHA
jgi:hypothetical protein